MRRLRCIAATVLLTLLPAWPAAADQRADVQRAKEAFKAGAAAYAAGEYLAAIQALESAYELSPLPQIAFSLAQAERRQYFVDHEREHLDRAIELFRTYIDQVPSGGRRPDALDALSQLEPLAARLQPPPAPATPAPSADPKRAAPVPTVAVRPTRVLVACDVPGARISLDGGPPQPAPLVREVKPGRHRVEASAPGFFTARRQISAVTGELVAATVALREKPGTLGIWTADGSEIYVDGAFVSPGGEGVLLQLPSGTHQIAVAKQGHRTATRTVRTKRGGAENIRIVLEPTSQRLASQILFISGGAALSGGLIMSSLAVRQENRAEDFLGKQEHHNVGSAELVAYDSAVTNRDRFRLAATVSSLSALGLFVTALFLHELDEPRRQDLYHRPPPRPPSPGRKKAPKQRSSVDVVPNVGPSQFGATLEGRF